MSVHDQVAFHVFPFLDPGSLLSSAVVNNLDHLTTEVCFVCKSWFQVSQQGFYNNLQISQTRNSLVPILHNTLGYRSNDRFNPNNLETSLFQKEEMVSFCQVRHSSNVKFLMIQEP